MELFELWLYDAKNLITTQKEACYLDEGLSAHVKMLEIMLAARGIAWKEPGMSIWLFAYKESLYGTAHGMMNMEYKRIQESVYK